MLKTLTVTLVSATTIFEEPRSAYCQFHVNPLERDVAKEISLEMADSLFRQSHVPGRGNTSDMMFVPRLEMVGSNWAVEFPLQKISFEAHPDLKTHRGEFTDVEVRSPMHVQLAKKSEAFILVMGIYFPILDWDALNALYQIEGPLKLKFAPMGQKVLPLVVEHEQTVGEFANAKASKKGRKLVRMQRVGGKR